MKKIALSLLLLLTPVVGVATDQGIAPIPECFPCEKIAPIPECFPCEKLVSGADLAQSDSAPATVDADLR